MKNSLPFAALTFAFTVAGSALGFALHESQVELVVVTGVIAMIGGVAAFVCRQDLP